MIDAIGRRGEAGMTGRTVGLLAIAWALGVLAGCGEEGISIPEDEPLMYGGGEFEQGIVSGGQGRAYLVVVPPSARPEVPAPLLLLYHGRPQSIQSLRGVTDMDRAAGARGWILVYPKALTGGWAELRNTYPATIGQNDVLFTHDIVEAVSEELNIDRSRIYAAGFSNGSLMTMRLACDLGDELAAVAPVAGTVSRRLDDDCAWRDPIPLVTFLGDRDNQFFWDGITTGTDRGYSGPETAQWYADRNGCADEREDTEVPDTADDGTDVVRWSWDDCGGADVTFYAIFGGGHTWPGSPLTFDPDVFGLTTHDISATEIILDFFEAHPKG